MSKLALRVNNPLVGLKSANSLLNHVEQAPFSLCYLDAELWWRKGPHILSRVFFSDFLDMTVKSPFERNLSGFPLQCFVCRGGRVLLHEGIPKPKEVC